MHLAALGVFCSSIQRCRSLCAMHLLIRAWGFTVVVVAAFAIGIWVSGMDFSDVMRTILAESSTSEHKGADFLRECLFGFEPDKIIAKTRPGRERLEMLEQRVSLMRLTPVMLVIQGERSLKPVRAAGAGPMDAATAAATSARYTVALEALLAAGARVEAKDVAGFTALAHASSISTTPWARDKCLPVLLKYGADVDAENRFGFTPLMDATFTENVANVSKLMELCANPSKKNRRGDGGAAVEYATPRIRQLLVR